MPIFQVDQPLRHNGRKYRIGVTVELDQEAAEQLLAIGIVAPPPGKATLADELTAIIAAILGLDPDDPSRWTADGKPQVVAIEAVLGRDTSAPQRNAAWIQIQAAQKEKKG
jgi:hypothetical protein